MIKYTGIMLIIIFFFSTGLYFSVRLKNRYEFLSAFREFLSALETNIRYNGGDIFKLIERSLPNGISEYFKTGSFNNMNEYFETCIKNIPKACALKKEDKSLIIEFGRLLGTADIDGELSHIGLYKELIETNIDNSIEELNQKSKLFKLLGLFSGIAAALLII